jgi:hypothetical protein
VLRAQRLSSEDRNLDNIFSKRVADLLATGLQEAFLDAARVVLQGS